MKYIISVFVLISIFVFMNFAYIDLRKNYKILIVDKKKRKRPSLDSSTFQMNQMHCKTK